MAKKRQYFKAVVGLAVLALGWIMAIPLLIDWKDYENEVADYIEAATGQRPDLAGKMDVSFFPIPHVEINQLHIKNAKGAEAENMLYVESVQANASLMNLLAGKLRLNKLLLVRPVIEVEELGHQIYNWHSPHISEHKRGFKVGKIAIKDGKIVIRRKLPDSKEMSVLELNHLNLQLHMHSPTGPFDIEGSLAAIGQEFEVEAHADSVAEMNEEGKISLALVSEDAKVEFTGLMKHLSDGPEMNGSLQVNVEDVGKLARGAASSLGLRGSLLSQIYSQEKLALTAQMAIAPKGGQAQMEIASENIQGKGNVKIFSGKSRLYEASLLFDKINIDGLKSVPPKEKKGKEFVRAYQTTHPLLDFDFSLPLHVSTLLDVNIKEFQVNQQKIHNIQLLADLFNQQVAIGPFSAKLPGETALRFSGVITHNGIRPKLVGNFALEGKDIQPALAILGLDSPLITNLSSESFKTEGDVTIIPSNVRFSDVKTIMDGSFINLSLSLKNELNLPKITTKITIDRLDMDKYKMIPHVSREEIDLFVKQINNTNPVNDFIWLRNFPVDISTELSVDEMTFNGQQYTDVLALVNVRPGMVQVERLKLVSPLVDCEFDGKLALASKSHDLLVNITGNKLDTSFLPIEFTAKKPGEAEGVLVPANPGYVPMEKLWPETPYDFRGLGKFRGAVTVSLQEFKHGLFALQNVDLVSYLESGVKVESFKTDIFGGQLEASGSLIANSLPTISTSYAFSNVKLEELLGAYADVGAFSGYISLSGTLSAYGTSPRGWITHLQGNNTFAGREIRVRGFDLNKIVEDAETMTIPTEVIRLQEQVIIEGETEFFSVDGQMQIVNGMARLANMQLTTPRVRAVMAGTISLGDNVMNLVSKFAFQTSDLRTITFTLGLKGFLYNLERKLDLNELVEYVKKKQR